MKKCLDAWTFIERCSHISFVHGGSGALTSYWPNIMFKTFSQYKWQAINTKKISFDLTEKEYIDLRNDKCFYCHRKTTHEHHNGIDRINSSIGYVLSNCLTCCYDCNIAKRDTTPDIFINHCKIISDKTHDFHQMPRNIYIMNN
jgi:hypothetical protein